MIHVEPQPEPPAFDRLVRQPGRKALADNRSPLPPYWRACLEDLYRDYRGICAYLCVLIPRGTGTPTTDHFVAKSSRPEDAYEWRNYRLACQLMNSRKGAFDEILDPFDIVNGWFVLELSGLQVLPNPQLEETLQEQIRATIDRLRLNVKECVDARAQFYDAYLEAELSFSLLEVWSPFVALELRRQGRAPDMER